MRVVAFNGSPRKNGNTSILVGYVMAELEKQGFETEVVHIGGKAFYGCHACEKCFENRDGKCVIDSDGMNTYIQKMMEADGIILASPTYYADLTPELKALIDRAGFVCGANGKALRRKVGAAVVAVRRAGAIHVFDSINHFFLINEMMVPGSSYWNLGIGRDIGTVAQDDEGQRTMVNLAKNMAWLLNKLHA